MNAGRDLMRGLVSRILPHRGHRVLEAHDGVTDGRQRERGTVRPRPLAALALVAALIGCDGSNGKPAAGFPEPEPGVFRMGTEPWLGYGPWILGNEQGIFRRQRVRVAIRTFLTDQGLKTALADGRLDAANVATHTALALLGKGVPIKAVLLLDDSREADAILGGPRVRSVRALRGKRVAFETASTSEILLRHALGAAGMSLDEIHPVRMAAARAGQELAAGHVDAAVTYEPYIAAALQRNPRLRLIYSAGADPGLISDVLVVRKSVIRKRPGQVAALIRAWDDAVHLYKAHTARAQAIITRAVGARPGALETAFAGVKLYSVDDNLRALSPQGAYLMGTLSDVKAAAVEAGLVSARVRTAALFTTRFLRPSGPR
jgi:NitT/TauT family transport system substrate-binding protein